MTYQVMDRRTGAKVGKPLATLVAATRKADKLDLQYGAIRYGVEHIHEAVWSQQVGDYTVREI